MRQVAFRLPLPAPELSPNYRGHWAPVARQKKAYRQSARMRCLEAMSKTTLEPTPWDAALVRYHFHLPTARKRDDDNLVAAMKSARDGIEDAGLVRDDTNITTLPVEMTKRSKDPHVLVTLTKDDWI